MVNLWEAITNYSSSMFLDWILPKYKFYWFQTWTKWAYKVVCWLKGGFQSIRKQNEYHFAIYTNYNPYFTATTTKCLDAYKSIKSNNSLQESPRVNIIYNTNTWVGVENKNLEKFKSLWIQIGGMENWTQINTKLLTHLSYLVCVNEGDIYLSTT